MKIEKGQIVALTSGEYSDYCLQDHVRALQGFDTKDAINAFAKERELEVTTDDNKRKYLYLPYLSGDNLESFAAWLVRSGYVELLDGEVVEWYLGSYNRLECP